MYRLELFLSVSGATGGDVKVAWNGTSGASGAMTTHSRGCMGPDLATTDVTNTNVRFERHNWNTSCSYGVDGVINSHVKEEGLVDNSAGGSGAFTLQWAQNASNATSTALASSSFAILERLV